MRRIALVVGTLTCLLVAWTNHASAQPLGEFNVLRYHPAPGPNNYFGVDGAAVRGEVAGAAGVQLDYAHEPFTLYSATCEAGDAGCETTGIEANVVQYTAAAHLWGSIALFNRIQIGLNVPLVLTEGDAFPNPAGPGDLISSGSGFTLGDPRLHVKANLLDDASGLRLGLAAWVTAPVAVHIAEGRFVGDEDPSFGGHAIIEYVNQGVHVAGNVGGYWRDGDTLFSTVAGPALSYGLAFGYDITPLVMVFGEIQGSTAFSGQVDENPLEARLGGRLRVDDVVFELGAGAGLVAGVGVPVFRVLGGFAWAPQRADNDGDGIDDSMDSCPADREDLDDWHDDDGCPEPDNDSDGLADGADRCPNEAEDMDGDADDDGCPDLDTDGDGVHDGYDSCPTQAEDMDGDRDDDGCPDADRDRDNIEDSADQCPDQPEDTDGFGDEDGCPETDFDGDNLPDDGDQCPDQPEDADGFEDEDGCAEEAGPPPAEETPADRRRRGR
ncbi:thrombospondin type 3 repeat-containing protein [Sandaracinus amylolyticus]|uniref:thrombospondin type 3 repeat-containing protein n=1 Tax=Sandaracinus amylolyticus TaxID=927083 RepID=UPI0012EE97F2|nr:thrombospondin type 3 repeat-containing protein [Sandaracinus amylolyticus]